MRRCRSCQAPVFFVKTVKGATMILNVASTPNGIIVLDPPSQPTDCERARVLTKAERAAPITMPRYTDHHATCPQANEWRKRRG